MDSDDNEMDSDDNELVAMRALYRILKSFDRAAQERIVGYVGNRLAQEERATWAPPQPECAPQIPGAAHIPESIAPMALNRALSRL